MATTHLFVELLVIGFGAFIWFLILIAQLLGYDLSQPDSRLTSVGFVLPMLSIVYVLGILTDRVADWIFDTLWDNKIFRKAYEVADDDPENVKAAKTAYFDHRRTLIVESPRLWQFLEYGRSRLRICRGWCLNALILLITIDLSKLINPQGFSVEWWPGMVGLNVMLIVLFVLCGISWAKLTLKEYKKIRRQADWIMKHKEDTKTQDIALSGKLNFDWEETADATET